MKRHEAPCSAPFTISHWSLGAILLCILYSLCSVNLSAQPISPKALKDSKGREFWLAYMPNEHNAGGRLDSLLILIAAERPTKGEIRYDGRVKTFRIDDVSQVYSFAVPYFYEVTASETFTSTGTFQVVADDEVTVYGANIADRTSDAFLVLPKDVLGLEHYVMSYNSDGRALVQGLGNNAPTRTPSQFIVVATEDDTDVRIIPTTPMALSGTTDTQQVRMQKGMAYLVQALMSRQLPYSDLTGSRVVSSKPVAVFSGHFRALIPAMGTGSRDCLIEQMPPVETWGKNAVVAPYPAPGGRGVDLGDFIRILAANNNTQLVINNVTVATLNAGQFYEVPLRTALAVTATDRILVAGFKQSASGNGGNGDPFMAVIPPAEQFLTRYRFVSVQGKQSTNGGGVGNQTSDAFTEHYVSIVIPTNKISGVVLDGSSINPSAFSTVGTVSTLATTGFSYATIAISEGVHSIRADTTFGITALGYGSANSYGYTAGQRYETDILPPRITARRACNGVEGAVYDSARVDSKLFWFDAPDTARKNIALQLGTLPRPADSLVFRATLLNPYEDGEFTITVLDSLELKTTQRILVPGLTVHVNPVLRHNEVVAFSTNAIALAAGAERCVGMSLVNYGATTQTITNITTALKTPEFSLQAALPIVLQPNERRTVNLCFKAERDGLFQDTIVIASGCVERRIATVQAESLFDRVPPTVTRTEDSCSRVAAFTFTDNRRFDAGVDRVNVLQSENCSVRTVRGTDGTIQTLVTVLNPRRDTFYRLQVVDSVGNEQTVERAIPGFNIRFVLPQTGLYGFGGTKVTTLTCATIQVVNDGSLPFTLDKTTLARNTTFSVPLGQFPLVITPGQPSELRLCFAPESVQDYNDTLRASKYCVTDVIRLSGSGVLGVTISESRCAVDLLFTAKGSTAATLRIDSTTTALEVRHFPDPASETASLHITTNTDEALTIALYSVLGTPVMRIPEQRFNAGVWDVVMDVSTLESGVYVYEVRSARSAKRHTGLVRVAR